MINNATIGELFMKYYPAIKDVCINVYNTNGNIIDSYIKSMETITVLEGTKDVQSYFVIDESNLLVIAIMED